MAVEIPVSWIGTDYVFQPDGTLLGRVHRRLSIAPTPGERMRTTQYWEPDSELLNHPLAKLAGPRIYDESVDGRVHSFHGPDVVGIGLEWGRSALTTRGLWPLNGHNFDAFVLLSEAQRRIVIGTLSNASEVVARLVGVMVPEKEPARQPVLSDAQWPGDVSQDWQGTIQTLSAEGELLLEAPMTRHYLPSGWEDTVQVGTGELVVPRRYALHLEPWGPRYRVSGSAAGIAKRYGWLIEIDGFDSLRMFLRIANLLDPEGEQLVGYRRWEMDGLLQRLDVIILKPVQ